MKSSHFSRRDFIKSAGVAGGILLLQPSIGAQDRKDFIFQRRCRDAGATIRKNFKNLTATELAAFKNGVTVMKSRPATNPTSSAVRLPDSGECDESVVQRKSQREYQQRKCTACSIGSQPGFGNPGSRKFLFVQQ